MSWLVTPCTAVLSVVIKRGLALLLLQALQLLGHVFLYLHLNDYQAATTVLRQCHALLDSLPDKHTREIRQLEAHLLMLGVSLALARGSLKDLDLGG